MQVPVTILNANTKREQGRKAQLGNIAAAKAVADIIRTTLGPRSMLKMLLDPNGSECGGRTARRRDPGGLGGTRAGGPTAANRMPARPDAAAQLPGRAPPRPVQPPPLPPSLPPSTHPPGIVLTNDGHAILREIDVTHPAAKVGASLGPTACPQPRAGLGRVGSLPAAGGLAVAAGGTGAQTRPGH
jgi:hypothetical protein